MQTTNNLGLTLYGADDNSDTFLNYRTAMSGVDGSNLDKIDKAYGLLNEKHNSAIESTENLFDMTTFFNVDGIAKDDEGYYYGAASAFAYAFSAGIPNLTFDENSQYYLSLKAYVDDDGTIESSNGLVFNFINGSEIISRIVLPNNATTADTYEMVSPSGSTVGFMAITASNVTSNVWHIKDVMLCKSSEAVEYVPHETAIDTVARAEIDGVYDAAEENVTPRYHTGTIDGTTGEITDELTAAPTICYTDPIYTTKITGTIYQEFPSSTSNYQTVSYASYDSDGNFIQKDTVVNHSTSWEVDVSYTAPDGTAWLRMEFTRPYYGVTFNLKAILRLGGVQNLVADHEERLDTLDLHDNHSWPLSVKRSYPDNIGVSIWRAMADASSGLATIIPVESAKGIEACARMGVRVIEGNVLKTDDVMGYIVLNTNGLTFGSSVYSLGGSDISSTLVSSKTLSWIQTHVRFRSMYDMYQTPVLDLETFLNTCRANGIIPAIKIADDYVRIIADRIMGQSNYIAIDGDPEYTHAPIITWHDYNTSAGASQVYADYTNQSSGYIYGLSNPSDITSDYSFYTMVREYLHALNLRIACKCTTPDETQRAIKYSCDYIAGAYQVGEFSDGNMCSIASGINFNDFYISSGVASNGVLTLPNGESISSPESLSSSVHLGKGSLKLWFTGTLHITMGAYIDQDFTSDGKEPLWLSTYFMEGVPSFAATASGQVTISGISYNASCVYGEYTSSEANKIKEAVSASNPSRSVTGTAVIVEDAAALPVDAATVQMGTIQEMNGYSAPWPAGGGKNLYSGSDFSIGGSGSGSAVSHTETLSTAIPAGTYYFSFDVSGTAITQDPDSGFSIALYNESDTLVSIIMSSAILAGGTQITPSVAIKKIVFSLDHATYKLNYSNIQIEQGSSKTSYAPYENRCPIYGKTSLKLNHSKTNVLSNGSLSSGSSNGITWTRNTDGSISISGTCTGGDLNINLATSSDAMILKGGLAYRLSMGETGHLSTYFMRAVCTRISDSATEATIYDFDPSATTLSEDCSCVAYLTIKNGTAVNTILYPQLEIGNTASAYEAYDGYNISLPLTGGGIVCGGTFNLLNGMLTITKALITVTSNTDLTVGTASNNVKYARVGTSYADMVSNDTGAISSLYPRATNMADHTFRIINTSIYVYDNSFTSASAAHEILDGTQFCYTLSTPIVVSTGSSVRLYMKRGENVLCTDGGDLSITYRQDVGALIQNLTSPDESDYIASSNIEQGQFFYISGKLYKATADISSGSAIVPGTNCSETSVASQLKYIWDAISALS